MDLEDTGLMLAELMCLADEWPSEVVTAIKLLEDCEGYNLFRSQRPIAMLQQQLDEPDGTSITGCK